MRYPEAALDVPVGKALRPARAEALRSHLGPQRGWMLRHPALPPPRGNKTGFAPCSSAITFVLGTVVPSKQRSTVPSNRKTCCSFNKVCWRIFGATLISIHSVLLVPSLSKFLCPSCCREPLKQVTWRVTEPTWALRGP